MTVYSSSHWYMSVFMGEGFLGSTRDPFPIESVHAKKPKLHKTSNFTVNRNRNRNRKLEISRVPTKAKSREPAYSQALNQNKIDRQRSKSRESGRQTVRRLWCTDGVWS